MSALLNSLRNLASNARATATGMCVVRYFFFHKSMNKCRKPFKLKVASFSVHVYAIKI